MVKKNGEREENDKGNSEGQKKPTAPQKTEYAFDYIHKPNKNSQIADFSKAFIIFTKN